MMRSNDATQLAKLCAGRVGSLIDGKYRLDAFLGAGMDTPALHNPDYDFPDDLIPLGARIFLRTARNILG